MPRTHSSPVRPPADPSPDTPPACHGAVPLPPLRLLPAPRWEPPYDDEHGQSTGHGEGHGWRRDPVEAPEMVQGTLALSFVLPSGVSAVPQAPLLRLLPNGGAVREEAGGTAPDTDDAFFGPQPTPRSLLPEPRQWAGRLVQAVVEVLAGDRPVTQLVRWADRPVYTDLERRASVAARHRRASVLPRQPAAAPVRPTVRSVHVSEPLDGVAEACALVQRGRRATAVALRLEGVDGRWVCTALQLG